MQNTGADLYKSQNRTFCVVNMIEIKDFRDFSTSNWYEKFEDIALKSILIKIPESVIEAFRLDEDVEVLLTKDCHKEFTDEVKNALNTLNNNAFVKNNWHAPIDAKMFSLGNSLKVSTLTDIVLFFTNSIIIQEDFMNVKGVDFYLVLKPYQANIHPAAEFRCIVINKILRGITPRDWPTYYSHFNEEGSQIIETLKNYFEENIKMQFSRDNYIFDVVLPYPSSPYILDFGPLNPKTNLYAFSWNEIHPLMNKDSPEMPPVFRFLESDIGIITKSEALSRFAKSQI